MVVEASLGSFALALKISLRSEALLSLRFMLENLGFTSLLIVSRS